MLRLMIYCHDTLYRLPYDKVSWNIIDSKYLNDSLKVGFRSNESDKRSFSKSITRLKLLIASCQSCETHDEWLLWAGTLVLVLFVSEQ